MLAIVEKDNRLIRHCRASKYKNGSVVGMRVPFNKNRGGTNCVRENLRGVLKCVDSCATRVCERRPDVPRVGDVIVNNAGGICLAEYLSTPSGP